MYSDQGQEENRCKRVLSRTENPGQQNVFKQIQAEPVAIQTTLDTEKAIESDVVVSVNEREKANDVQLENNDEYTTQFRYRDTENQTTTESRSHLSPLTLAVVGGGGGGGHTDEFF